MTWALEVAARTLAQEVRGEPPEGQAAVAHVLKNRLASGRWGHSLASVCLWRGQFSGWYVPSDPNFAYACGLKDDDPVLVKMRGVMQAALDSHGDPTNGALHYVNLSVVEPVWIRGATVCGKFGHHTFYKDVK
jgi:spore germination cell wall hydrolase CwlJ-like protein